MRHHHHDHSAGGLFGCMGEHQPWLAMGRHHRGFEGGQGRHGGFGGFGEGGGFTRGRKFSSEDLQLLLLALLAEKPAHGYELIKELESRSNGFYAPSPGMVYPALTYLEELSQVTVTQEGNRKCYELAEAGREYLAANQERAELMLERLRLIAGKMDSVRRAFAGEAEQEEGAPGEGWLPELLEARCALKAALIQSVDQASDEEQQRIAAILVQAARQILHR